jgi:flagellar protein FlaF
MQSASQAYGKVATQTLSPRDLEAHLLLKAASRLQAVRDGWDAKQGELDAALQYNRKLWSIFMTAMSNPGNPLPKPIRENVANLGLFVFNQTFAIMFNRKPEALGTLININREVAAGLRSQA